MCGAAANTRSSDSAGQIESGDRRLLFRWSTLVAVLLWAAVSAVLLVTTVPLRMPRAGLLAGGDDFDAYRDGVQHVMAHLPLYTEPLIHQHLYTYPPFSTLMFFPFALLPFGADTYIWLAANLVVLVAVVALCWRMLGYRITPYLVCISALLAIACAFLEPVRGTLLHGQINLVVMLLVLWDTSRGERSRLKGIGVGIAAGIKLTPAYFVLYYLVARQWRAATVALATIAATVGVGWIVLPDDSRQYWAGTFFDSARIGDDLRHPSNQSLRGAIARLMGEHPTSAIGPLTGKAPPTWLWLLAAALVVAVSMWITARLYRAGELLLAVTVTGLSATVVSPFSWTHHWVWFLPLIIYAVHRALTNSWWWLCAATLFVAIGSWPYRFPGDTEPRIGLYMFPDTWVPWDYLSNLFILLYAAIMIGAAVLAIRKTRPSESNYQDSNQVRHADAGDGTGAEVSGRSAATMHRSRPER
jgi:alpha-1,2-mannosyltransferase